MATEFCPLCQNVVDKLFVKDLYQPADANSDLSPDTHTIVQRFPHVGNNRDLVSSSQSCSFCCLIKDALYNRYSQSPRTHSVQDFEATWLGSCGVTLEARGGNRFRAPYQLDQGLQLCSLYIGTIHGYYLGELVSIYAERGSPAVTSGDVLGIGPLNDSSSDDSLSVLQGWMAECVANHACGHFTGASGEDETANPELPTRILEISTEKSGFTTVRLVESRGMHGRYAALSHSWGPPDKQPLRTTKATYGRHLGGIAASDLPKTFREAARVAQAVGLQYLWIDSLCIIQDDKDDWSSEAPRMGPLYGKAFLVIAASGATNSTEGCFVPRWPPLLSLRIPYPSTGGYGQKSHVVLQIRLPHTALSPVFSPLGNRGWVLQEWWLARRIIHYTAAGMTWSCKRVKEMGEDCFHSRSADTPQEKLSWDGVIESYTIRRLTFLSDKTIAVQGLADAMQRSLENDAYHHGMWTSDMPQQLFWVGTHTTRPKELQDIPSWSWASTDGRCLTLSHRKFPWEPLPATLAVEDGKELVVSCHSRTCSLKKWKEFNHGAASEPPLSKASAPVTIMYNLPIHYTGKMTHQIVDEDTNEVLGIAMLDDVEAAGDCIQGCISAFLMKEVREAHHAQPCVTYFSLILQAVRSGSGSETYQRLGVGFVVDEDRVQGGTERTFRIV